MFAGIVEEPVASKHTSSSLEASKNDIDLDLTEDR